MLAPWAALTQWYSPPESANNPDIRQRVCSNMEFLGIRIDPEKNRSRGIEIDISTDDAKVRTLIIPTNEELAIAKETIRLIGKA